MRRLLLMALMVCAMAACNEDDKHSELAEKFTDCYARMYKAAECDDYDSFKEANIEVLGMMSGMSEGEKSTARKALEDWKRENSEYVEVNGPKYDAMKKRYNDEER